MEAAAVDKGRDAYLPIPVMDLVADNRSILVMDHEDGLLNLGCAHRIKEPWKRIEAKLPKMLEALRMDGAGILVIGQGEASDLLVQRREQKHSLRRRVKSSHEKAMIGAGVGPTVVDDA